MVDLDVFGSLKVIFEHRFIHDVLYFSQQLH